MNSKQAWIACTLMIMVMTTEGDLFARGRVKQPERNTVSEIYIHRYGVTVPQNEWIAQGRTGKVIKTYKSGVKETAHFKEGVPHGEIVRTFPFSQVVETILTYDNGRLVKEESNYTTGTIKEQIEHLPNHQTSIKRFYEQGNIRSIENFENDKLARAKYYNLNQNVESGVENGFGKVTNRDSFGQLVSIDTIENGLVTSSTTYHPNGMPKSVAHFKEGKIHGLRRTFYPGGDPETIERWENGLQHGITQVYQDGEKISDIPYVNGVRHGVEKRLKDERNVVEEVTWNHDFRHGPTYKYIEGRVVTEWFHQDQPVTKNQYERLNSTLH